MRILILGGTGEASALARMLCDDTRFRVTLSLAGRTSKPARQPVPTRVGGFGGVDGLADTLKKEAIDVVVDATHPYAVRISENALAACSRVDIPLLTIARPPWQRRPGDNWIDVPNFQAAADALGPEPRKVFLSVGRLELSVFSSAPQHDYFARLIDPPDEAPMPPRLRLFHARGPFDFESERKLLVDENVDVVVSKNSGGPQTYAKIEAARALKLPVVMVARRPRLAPMQVETPEAVCRALEELHAQRFSSASLRGV